MTAAVVGGAGRSAAARAGSSRAAAKPPTSAPAAKRPRRGPRRRPPAGKGSNLNDLGTQEERTAELQRRRQVAAEPATEPAPAAEPAPVAETRSGGVVRGMEPATSGAGAVLGVLVWVVVSNFIEGGAPQVKRLLRAKFFNRTD